MFLQLLEYVIDHISMHLMEVTVACAIEQPSHRVFTFNLDRAAVLGPGCLNLQFVAGRLHIRIHL